MPPLEPPSKTVKNVKHICKKSEKDLVPKCCDKCLKKEHKIDSKRTCLKTSKINDQLDKKESKTNIKNSEKEIVVMRVKCECSEQGLKHATPGYDCTPNRIKSILRACEGTEKLNKQILRTNGLIKQNDNKS